MLNFLPDPIEPASTKTARFKMGCRSCPVALDVAQACWVESEPHQPWKRNMILPRTLLRVSGDLFLPDGTEKFQCLFDPHGQSSLSARHSVITPSPSFAHLSTVGSGSPITAATSFHFRSE